MENDKIKEKAWFDEFVLGVPDYLPRLMEKYGPKPNEAVIQFEKELELIRCQNQPRTE